MKKIFGLITAEKAAVSALLLVAAVIFVGMAGFWFGISLGIHTFIIGTAGILIYTLLRDRSLFASTVLNLILLSLWAAVCRLVFDYSYDAMYYHKQAIITLKEGWIPIWKSAADADVFASYLDIGIWMDHYPKGIWMFSAAIYSVTNLLETAKAVNILFIIPVFAFSLDTLRTVYGFSKKKGIAFAFLFALNPVFIYQMFTSYNDIIVGCLVILAVLTGIRICSKTAGKGTYTLLFLVASISCTVKYTCPVLVGLCLLFFGIFYAVQEKFNWKQLKKPVAVTLSAFMAGVLIFSFDPYIKHVVNGVNIAHPILGKDSIDVINVNPPPAFEGMFNGQKAVISLFSKTDNIVGRTPELKVPFTIHKDETVYLHDADLRIGGFGVLFSGVLILALMLLAFAALSKTKAHAGTLAALLLFLLLTLFFPESWWARYASYIYYIPVFILIYCQQNKNLKWPSAAVGALLFINSAIIILSVASAAVSETKLITDKLEAIKAADKKVFVRTNDFTSHIKLFSEYGIDFEASHKALDKPEIFYRTTKYQFDE